MWFIQNKRRKNDTIENSAPVPVFRCQAPKQSKTKTKKENENKMSYHEPTWCVLDELLWTNMVGPELPWANMAGPGSHSIKMSCCEPTWQVLDEELLWANIAGPGSHSTWIHHHHLSSWVMEAPESKYLRQVSDKQQTFTSLTLEAEKSKIRVSSDSLCGKNHLLILYIFPVADHSSGPSRAHLNFVLLNSLWD